MRDKEISGFESIVNLCTLAKWTKSMSTKEHLKHFFGIIKDTYKEQKSMPKSLKAGLGYEAAITLARGTYLLSKVYKKNPKIVPEYITTNTGIGISAEVLSRM